MGKTKKVRSAGRYGVRYGLSVRKRLLKVEDEQLKKHVCPSCKAVKVSRLHKGVFQCKKCNLKFTGGSFLPITQSGGLVRKMITQKNFNALLAQATAAEESDDNEEDEKPRSYMKKKKPRKNAKKSEETETVEETGVLEDPTIREKLTHSEETDVPIQDPAVSETDSKSDKELTADV